MTVKELITYHIKCIDRVPASDQAELMKHVVLDMPWPDQNDA